MSFVRGSNAWRKLYRAQSFAKSALDYADTSDREPVPDIEADRAAYDLVTWDLEPGDLIAFGSYILHGAPGNGSDHVRRRAYTVRYTGDDVVYAPGPATMPVLDNPELKAGQALDSRLFPVVWRDGAPVKVSSG